MVHMWGMLIIPHAYNDGSSPKAALMYVGAALPPSCILHGISCSIVHDTSMMHIRPYTTLTHMHALTGQHAYTAL